MLSVSRDSPSGRNGRGHEDRSNSRGGFSHWTEEEAYLNEWEVFSCVSVSLLVEIS